MKNWQAVLIATMGLWLGACGSDSDSSSTAGSAEAGASGSSAEPNETSPAASAEDVEAAKAAPAAAGVTLSDAMKAFAAGLGDAEKALTNPFSGQAKAIESGKAEYQRLCFQCHGKEGKGDGPAAQALGVAPPDFTSPDFAKLIPMGVQFQVMKHGVPGTAMQAFGAAMSDEQIWKLLAYVESLAAGSR